MQKLFTSDYILQFWKFEIAKLPMLCIFYALFEGFIHNAENVTQTIYASQIIPRNKIVPYWVEAS